MATGSGDEARVYVSGDASDAVKAMQEVGDAAEKAGDQAAEANAKVAESAEGAKEKVDELAKSLDEVGATDARPRVEPDTADADAKLDDTKERLDELDATRADPKVDLDDEELTTKLASRREALTTFGDQTFSPRLDADDEELQTKLDQNLEKVDELNHKFIEVKTGLRGNAKEEMDALEARLTALNEDVYEPDVSLRGVAETRDRLDELDADLRALSEKWARPGVKLEGDADAIARLEALSERMGAIRDDIAVARVQLDGDVVSEGKLSTIEATLLRVGKLVATPDIDLEGVARSEGQLAGLEAQMATLRGTAADLKALGAEASAPGVRVQGVEQAVGRLKELRQHIDDLKGDIGDARVQVQGDATALGKLSTIEASLLRVGKAASAPHIDLQGVAQAEGQVSVLQGRLESLRESATKAADGVDQTAKAADTAQKATVGVAQAALLASPALIDVGLYGAAGMMSVAAMAGTAALGMGAFVLAAGGLKAVEADVMKVVAAWRQMEAPVTRPAVMGILPVVQQGLADLTPLVAATSHALEGLEHTASAALGGPFWQSFFGFLAGEAGPAIRTFGHLIGGLADTMAGLYQAFAPVISNVEGGLNQLAGDMVNVGHAANSNGGLKEFVDFLVSQSTPVGNTLHQIAADAVGLVKAILPLGPPLVAVVHGLADLLGVVERVSPGLLTAGIAAAGVAKAFSLVKPGIEPAKQGVQDFLNTISLLQHSDGVQAAGAFGKAIQSAGDSLGNLAGKSGIVANALDTIGLGFLKTEASAQEAAAATRTFAVDSTGAATEATVAGATMATGIGAAVAAVVAGAALMVTAYAQLPPAVGQAQKAAEGFGQSMATTVVSSIESSGRSVAEQTSALEKYKAQLTTTAETASRAWPGYAQAASVSMGRIREMAQQSFVPAEQDLGKYNGAMSVVNEALSQMAGRSRGTAQATDLLSAATSHAVSPTQALQHQLTALVGQANAASTAASNFGSALTALDGNQISAQQALVTTAQDFNSLTGALQKSKGEMEGTGTNVLAAKSAFLTFGQQINTTASAMVQAGQPTSAINAYLDTQRQRLLTLAAEYPGLRGEISKYLAELHLTPQAIHTEVRLAGVAEAKAQLSTLHAGLLADSGAYQASINVVVHGASATNNGIHITAGANGIGSHEGGLALVGEQGPEVAVLPRGTTVIPHGPSMALLKSLGPGIKAYAGGTPDAAAVGPFVVDAGVNVALGLHPGGGFSPQFVTAGRQIINSLLAGMASSAPLTAAVYDKIAAGLPQAVDNAIQAARPRTIGALHTFLNGLQTSAHTALTDLSKGIAGPISALPAQVQAATAEINRAFAGTQLKAVVDSLNGEFRRLETGSASSLTAVTNRLKAAQAAVATIKQEIASTSQQIQSAYSIIPPTAAAGTATAAGTPADSQDLSTDVSAGGTSGTSLQAQIEAQMQQAKDFNADLKLLASWGLDQNLLMMLAQAGYATGLPVAAQLIASGKDAISPLNAAESALNAQEQQIQAMANPTTPPQAPPPSPTVQQELEAELQQLREYQAILKKLAADGLDQALLTQLVQAGYQAGMPVAKQLLASGKQGIKAANYLEGQVEAASNGIAKLVSQAAVNGKQVGLATAEGIVTELEKEQKRVEAQMKALAADMRLTIEDALAAKGGRPSAVFMKYGAAIVDGLAAGLRNNQAHAVAAISELVAAMTGAIRKDLGIHSPSTVGIELGRSFAEGVAIGVTGGEPLTTSAVGQLGTSMRAGLMRGGLGAGGAALGTGASVTLYAPVTITAQGDISPTTARYVTSKVTEHLTASEQRMRQEILTGTM